MPRTDRSEVPTVEREHGAHVQALRNSHHGRVYESDAVVSVLPHQLNDARKVNLLKHLHMHVTLDDQFHKAYGGTVVHALGHQMIHLWQNGHREDQRL